MQFSVIGNPISHSFSPILFNSVFRKLNVTCFYGRYLLDTNMDVSFIRGLALSGANITIPFKEKVFDICDEVIGIAKDIGAINTLVFKESKIYGYNTDAYGFYNSIKIKIKNALIIGAGGSSKALAYILDKHGIKVTIINRSSDKLSSFIKSGYKCCAFDDFIIDKFDLVINATPSSLYNQLPMDHDVMFEIIRNAKMAFDLVYGVESPFLSIAKNMDLITHDGKEMLINQAVLSYAIFMDSLSINYNISEVEAIMRDASLIF